MPLADLPITTTLLLRGMEENLHKGGQLYIWRQNKVWADWVFGEAREGVEMTPDTLLLWLSATKPIVAIAIAQLIERKMLSLDDPVARYIPEFSMHGKDKITLRHCLTHTGGFRTGDLVSEKLPWNEAIAQVCAVRPEPRWVPGERAGYHTSGSWRILGEMIHRVDGRMPDRYVREEIFLPLGMPNSWISIPLQEQSRYSIGLIYNMQDRLPSESYFNTPEGVAQCGPGTSGRGSARELGRFYQMLLHGGELEGVRIVQAQTAQEWTSPQRVGMLDETFKHIVDWGYGFKLNSNQYGVDSAPYGFGKRASEQAFGHSGSQSVSAFADPAYNLVVVIALNGRPGEALHQARSQALHEAVYQDLGI